MSGSNGTARKVAKAKKNKKDKKKPK